MPKMTQNHVFGMNVAAAITEHHFIIEEDHHKGNTAHFCCANKQIPNFYQSWGGPPEPD